ncbi:diguanylate cyclase [Candidatus Woesearchaeota archaeon]|nr:diguanylate cyclase [Candidatus Woesearchaeota archaeon]
MDGKISETLDMELWNSLQDNFSESIETVVYTVDRKGEEISSSKEFPFFCQVIKSKDKGLSSCRSCRLKFMERLEKEGRKLILYYCHAGLLNIIAPIKVKGEQVGAVICGAILKERIDQAVFDSLSREIGIESEELLENISTIPATKEEKIKEYSRILSLLSTTLPELVHQKKMSERRIEELNILHKVAQSVSHVTELSKTLEKVKENIRKIIYIEDCSVIIFSSDKAKKEKTGYDKIEEIIEKEILSSKKIVKVDSLQDDPRFRNKGISYLPHSLIAIPLIINSNMMGCVIFYLYPTNKTKKDDLNFLWVLSDQISMAVLNSQNLEKIKNKAITDKLTGLYNREFFMNILEMEMIRSVRLRNPLSITLMDIDDFKHYNDTHGHIRGDSLLKDIAKIIKDETRESDVVGRYGGEEFIIISLDTNSNVAFDMIEKIRKKIEENSFFGKEDQPLKTITISAGLITCMDRSISAVELIKEADKSLYTAKAEGKNRVKSTVIVDKDLYPVDVQRANDFNRQKSQG